MTDVGLPCGVFLAPVLPGLTDGVEHSTPASRRSPPPGTGVTVVPCACDPAPGNGSWPGCPRAHPELVARYEQLYARRAYVPAEYRTWLAERVAPMVAKRGLDRQSGGAARGKADDGIRPACPATRRSAFRRGACRTGGLPVTAADHAPATVQTQARGGGAARADLRAVHSAVALLGKRGDDPYGCAPGGADDGEPGPHDSTFTRAQLVQALDRLQAEGGWSPDQAAELLQELDRLAAMVPPSRRTPGRPRPGNRLAEAAG